jgi:hypothetical protein
MLTYITIRCGYSENLPPVCRKEVHNTDHKHRVQYVVDVSQYGHVVQYVVDITWNNSFYSRSKFWNLSIRGRSTRRGYRQGTVKGLVHPEAAAPTRRGMNIYSQLSGLEDVGFNDFRGIKDDN